MKNCTFLVVNKTRGLRLAESAELAHSLFRRMKGLIGRSAEDFLPGKALWIQPCDGIHTFGMRFAIDAIYLDQTGVVLRVYQGLRPFRIAAIVLSVRSVLELPVGTVARTATQVGDILEFHTN